MYGTIIKTSPAVPDHRGVLVRFAIRVEYGEVPYMVQQEFSHGRACNPEKGWHDMTGYYSATLVLRHMIEAIDTAQADTCPRCEVGTVSQQTWTSDGRTIHGGMECEDCGWREAYGQPCDKCSVYVPTGYHCGNDRADGTSEYLCPDCYTPEGE